MEKLFIMLIFSTLFLFACKNKNTEFDVLETNDSLKIHQQDSVHRPKNYSVVSEDFIGDWLQRLFVETTYEVISDSVQLRNMVDDIYAEYPLSEKSSISFFKDSNFAMYLDEFLRKNEKSSNLDSLVERWKNEQYLGEYSFVDSSLKLYPVSTINRPK